MNEGLNKSENGQENLKKILLSKDEIEFLVDIIQKLRSGEMKGTNKEHLLEILYDRLKG